MSLVSGSGVSAAKVRQIYNSLLERDPEPGIGANQQDPIDYCISVALSAEREALQRQKYNLENQAGGQLAISRSPYGGHWVTDISDAVIGQSLRTSGAFEEEEIAQVTKFLTRLERWQAGKTFVDVGSNIGTHTIFALHNGFSSAICFEPDQKNFRLLQVNQLLNGVNEKCRNFNIAASNFEGMVEFELSPNNFGDHRIRSTSLSEGDELYAEKSRMTVDIKAAPVSSFLSKLGMALTEIGLIWIDTQGHDGHVLAGCSSLLEARVPVVAELWPYGLKRVDGYPLFRGAVDGKRIFDLRSLDSSGLPVELQMADLDNLHDLLIQQESQDSAAHTDLLVF
jgi:FkbM family methyltransferase